MLSERLIFMGEIKNNPDNNFLKLKVPFLDAYKEKMQGLNVNLSDMPVPILGVAPNADKSKGLKVEQDENTKYEYNENGNIKSKTILDPDTGKPQKTILYNFFGFTEEEILYNEDAEEHIKTGINNEKIHTFIDSKTGNLTFSAVYDAKGRIKSQTFFDKENGFIERDESYNPETGKLETLLEYNPKVQNQLLKSTYYNDKYPETVTTRDYDEQSRLSGINIYKEDKLETRIKINPENGHQISETLYDKNGNELETKEIIAGKRISKTAGDIYENIENVKKLNTYNLIEVFEDYEVKSGGQTIIDKLLEIPDEKQRTELLTHIKNTINEKLEKERTDVLELYCNDKETVDKGITYIQSRLASEDNIKNSIETALAMIKNSDYFIDVANGRIDKPTYQGNTGDCWLLAALNGIAETENGQQLLQKILEVDEKTGEITVKLCGGKKSYTVTKEELQKSSHLSKGDYDMRAVEIAFEKYFSEVKPNGIASINGNSALTALEILTGSEPKFAFTSPDGKCSVVISDQKLDLIPENKQQFKNIPMKILNDFPFDTLEKMQPDIVISCGANTSPYDSHQYWIKIEGDKITVKEPHNNTNEKIYTREEFRYKFNGGLDIMIL